MKIKKGIKITVEKRGYKRYFAKVPSITRQYLGFGHSKTEAIADAKKTLKHIKVKRRK